MSRERIEKIVGYFSGYLRNRHFSPEAYLKNETDQLVLSAIRDIEKGLDSSYNPMTPMLSKTVKNERIFCILKVFSNLLNGVGQDYKATIFGNLGLQTDADKDKLSSIIDTCLNENEAIVCSYLKI